MPGMGALSKLCEVDEVEGADDAAHEPANGEAARELGKEAAEKRRVSVLATTESREELFPDQGARATQRQFVVRVVVQMILVTKKTFPPGDVVAKAQLLDDSAVTSYISVEYYQAVKIINSYPEESVGTEKRIYDNCDVAGKRNNSFIFVNLAETLIQKGLRERKNGFHDNSGVEGNRGTELLKIYAIFVQF
ncbi:hypothetical protein PsorP6_009898 [Peronosclerospora sorghi]|uniref:Uncharacterized protein n=1 Tax=Peronosclerospora sorghi TaxID=230839 RepID=A0ACC0VY81_9STRA|nr:hypothetical protein PsorP6_009898 [Peronosclerospora sorghi]